MAYVLGLLAFLCLIPSFFPADEPDPRLAPKARQQQVSISLLFRLGPIFLAGMVVTVFGVLHVMRGLEMPVWSQIVYASLMGAFWIACVRKNLRDLRTMVETMSPAKTAGLSDDSLA